MESMLAVENLRVYFYKTDNVIKAVDGISFAVKKDEVFGLVGESGCGKSTTALAIMRMLADTAKIVEGKIELDKEDITRVRRRNLRNIWGKSVFMIFQDPMTSLNPVMTIKDQFEELLRVKEGRKLPKGELQQRCEHLLRQVEIPDSERVLSQFPHQLSGGMKQRVMIAFGIALHPKLLILDEPTTALDSTVQFKIVELLIKLKKEHRMSQVLITHDFGVAAKMCDKIAVMYAGKIVEQGTYMTLLKKPRHPYTQGLFKCIIKSDTQTDYLETMEGSLPSLLDLPKGCYFEKRCNMSEDVCREKAPALIRIEGDHFVACHKVLSS